MLNGDGDLVIFCLVYHLETLSDLVGSIEPSYVDHLILGDIVCDQDLSIDIIVVPDVTSFRINCQIGTFEIAIDIRFYATETEDAAYSLVPDHPVGVIKGLLHLGNAGV